MIVLIIVRINAKNPKVAKDPILPVGQPDRPVSTRSFLVTLPSIFNEIDAKTLIRRRYLICILQSIQR